MNRRQFLMGSAAALVAAPAASSALREMFDNALYDSAPMGEGWFIVGYDPATGKDHGALLYARIHDEQIYITDYEKDFSTDKLRARWRASAPEIAKWWGTHGR